MLTPEQPKITEVRLSFVVSPLVPELSRGLGNYKALILEVCHYFERLTKRQRSTCDCFRITAEARRNGDGNAKLKQVLYFLVFNLLLKFNFVLLITDSERNRLEFP